MLKRYLEISKRNNLNYLVIDNLNKVDELKQELNKANIKEFVLADSSSKLMDIIHSLDTVNIKFKECITLEYENEWNEHKEIKGILMQVID